MEQSLDNDLVKCIYEGLDMKHTEPSQLSPLVLAYIGDSIYDLVIKTWVIEQGNMQVNKLNKKTQTKFIIDILNVRIYNVYIE